jgi:carbamate kinase
MGPKVEAAQEFARATGGRAVICALADVPAAVRGEKGSTIADNPVSEAGDVIAFH